MSSWPVEVVDFGALIERKVESGEPTQATLLRRPGSGEPSGWIINCPLCGELGTAKFGEDGHKQTSVEGDPLTLEPSLACRCGGHYYVYKGVLMEDPPPDATIEGVS